MQDPIISFFRGDSVTYDFTVTKSGTVADITGCQVFFTVKPDLDTADAAKTFQKTVGNGITLFDPVAGIFRVTIDEADTKYLDTAMPYVWDVEVKTPDGKPHTPEGLSGLLVLKPDVFRDTP